MTSITNFGVDDVDGVHKLNGPAYEKKGNAPKVSECGGLKTSAPSTSSTPDQSRPLPGVRQFLVNIRTLKGQPTPASQRLNTLLQAAREQHGFEIIAVHPGPPEWGDK